MQGEQEWVKRRESAGKEEVNEEGAEVGVGGVQRAVWVQRRGQGE